MAYYLNAKTWEINMEPPGTKIPTLLVFPLVALLGAIFLMFLPLIGFALVGRVLVTRIAAMLGLGAKDIAANVQPGQFVAGNAYFAGNPGNQDGAPGEDASHLDGLEEEIQSRRQN